MDPNDPFLPPGSPSRRYGSPRAPYTQLDNTNAIPNPVVSPAIPSQPSRALYNSRQSYHLGTSVFVCK